MAETNTEKKLEAIRKVLQETNTEENRDNLKMIEEMSREELEENYKTINGQIHKIFNIAEKREYVFEETAEGMVENKKSPLFSGEELYLEESD